MTVFLICDPPAVNPRHYDIELLDKNNDIIHEDQVPPDTTGTYGFVHNISELNLPDGTYTARARAVGWWAPSKWVEHIFEKLIPSEPVNLTLSMQ